MISNEILKKVKQIEIKTSRLVDDLFSGEYESVFKGHGIEFAEVREYMPGDDIRSIDWNVSARFGKLFVKKYSEERELNVVLMVDISASEVFGSSLKTKRELESEIAAIIAFSALKNNDKVGLILFSDTVEKFVPPKKGRRHILRIIRDILFYEAKSKGTDINSALKTLNDLIKRKAVVFLLSDFMASDYEKLLKITNKKHDLIAINISDPIEKEMPPSGIVLFEDAETGEKLYVNTNNKTFRNYYKESAISRKNKMNELLRSINMDYIHFNTNEAYIKPLIGFFKMRARKFR